MKVELKKLKLSHFKGIKSLEMDFQEGENFLHGKNASGKTTVFDSVWFLFFGKDSLGRSDFGIKTLDANNNPIEKVDHEVFAAFQIDSESKTFQRTYKQLWSKEGVLKGHTTAYQIDGFPVTLESNYRKQVEEFFKEELFKLLTNPLFFNSMKPADRREALISMASEISTAQIFEGLTSKSKKSPHIKELEELLTIGRNLDQIRAKAAMEKKNLKEEKADIPVKISEAERSKPEEAYEFSELQEIIAGKKNELEEVELSIRTLSNSDSVYNKSIQEWENKIYEAKSKLQKLKFLAQQDFEKWKNDSEKSPREIQAKIKELNEYALNAENSIKTYVGQIQRHKSDIETSGLSIPSKETEKAALVAEWQKENAKEFMWNGSSCPSCERPLEGDMLFNAEEAARGRFNKDKTDRKAEITQKGMRLKNQIEGSQKDIESSNNAIRATSKSKSDSEAFLSVKKEDLITLEASLKEWYANPQDKKTVDDFQSQTATFLIQDIAKLESNKPIKSQEVNTSELKTTKIAIQTSLEGLQKALGNKETIEKIDIRIQELKDSEKIIGQKISEAEGMEDACFTYSKARVEMIESEINAKFSLVSFKLFYMPLNGAEKEVCETLFKGVPFSDLNNAGRIQAGLDIINTLSDHYKLYLPIFIDNRESVTWIPETKSQLINLVVDPSQEKLTLHWQ
jgi:DNA repair exonuclease SbcCD ATPase subunit